MFQQYIFQLKWYYLFDSAKHYEECSMISELKKHTMYWMQLQGKE